jgi:hypothetical protein
MNIVFRAAGIAFVLLMIAALIRSSGKKEFTEEAFERESKRPSLIRTGLQEFQDLLEPEKKAAFEIVKGEKRKTDSTTPGAPPGRRPILAQL